MGLNFVPYIVYLIRKTNIRIWNYFDLPDLVTLFRLIIVTVLIKFVIVIPLEQVDIFYKLLMDSKIRFLGTSINSQTLLIVATSKWILFPFIEEILYRGLILRQFLIRYPPTKAILLSSLIFSFAHLRYEGFAGLFILGIVLGIFYYKTNSILVSSISHCIFNLAAVLMHYENLSLDQRNLIVCISIFFISTLFVILLLRKPMNAVTINTLIYRNLKQNKLQ
jgi:membrane protease YdiL (CAAX protease family)